MQSLLEPLEGKFLYIKNRNSVGVPYIFADGGRVLPVREYIIKFNNPISPFDSKGLL
jgi:hypothetical protein